MKTTVVMNSKYRELFGNIIRQDTSNMLNVSDLELICSKRNALSGYAIKHIPEIMSRKENLERIYYILHKQSILEGDLNSFLEQANERGIITYLKKINSWKTTGARQNKTVWANPYIWMLLALEMSPEVYGSAIIWLSDKLILNRIEAGNFYKGLTKSISKFDNIDFVSVAKGLNYIVFNKHEKNIRNSATIEQLKELEDIEKKLSFAIDMGYIKSKEELLNEMRKMWRIKFSQVENYK